jgi:hypothetical protein
MKKLFVASAFAIASATTLFVSSPARAACLQSNLPSTSCSLFNPTSPTTVTDGGFTDSVWIANDRITDISFTSAGITSGFNITLTGIEYSTNGGTSFTSSGLSSTSYTITANGAAGTGTNLLTPINLPGAIGTNFQLRYTIPSIPGLTPVDGTAGIVSFVRNQQITGPSFTPQTQSRTTNAYIPPTVPTPGPLPLLGAGVAFTFSRTARKRIRQAV